MALLRFEINGSEYSQFFYVIRDLSNPVVIGVDFLAHHGFVLDVESGGLSRKTKPLPTPPEPVSVVPNRLQKLEVADVGTQSSPPSPSADDSQTQMSTANPTDPEPNLPNELHNLEVSVAATDSPPPSWGLSPQPPNPNQVWSPCSTCVDRYYRRNNAETLPSGATTAGSVHSSSVPPSDVSVVSEVCVETQFDVQVTIAKSISL